MVLLSQRRIDLEIRQYGRSILSAASGVALMILVVFAVRAVPPGHPGNLVALLRDVGGAAHFAPILVLHRARVNGFVAAWRRGTEW